MDELILAADLSGTKNPIILAAVVAIAGIAQGGDLCYSGVPVDPAMTGSTAIEFGECMA
jgi:hypothetical protein